MEEELEELVQGVLDRINSKNSVESELNITSDTYNSTASTKLVKSEDNFIEILIATQQQILALCDTIESGSSDVTKIRATTLNLITLLSKYRFKE